MLFLFYYWIYKIVVLLQVRIGDLAVQGASVLLEAVHEGEGAIMTSLTTNKTILLVDDGIGDPDIKAGDGVYSR